MSRPHPGRIFLIGKVILDDCTLLRERTRTYSYLGRADCIETDSTFATPPLRGLFIYTVEENATPVSNSPYHIVAKVRSTFVIDFWLILYTQIIGFRPDHDIADHTRHYDDLQITAQILTVCTMHPISDFACFLLASSQQIDSTRSTIPNTESDPSVLISASGYVSFVNRDNPSFTLHCSQTLPIGDAQDDIAIRCFNPSSFSDAHSRHHLPTRSSIVKVKGALKSCKRVCLIDSIPTTQLTITLHYLLPDTAYGI